MLRRALTNSRQLTASARLFLYLSSALFTLVGLGFTAVLIFEYLLPLYEQNDTRGWVQVPCKVTSCVTAGRRFYVSDFAYEYGGTGYSSKRQNFYSNSSRIRFALGDPLSGWIDPNHPQRFVQDITYTPRWYAVLLLFLAAALPLLSVLRLVHGVATCSPSILRYLGEGPGDG